MLKEGPLYTVGGLQPFPRDWKINGVVAMLDDKNKRRQQETCCLGHPIYSDHVA